VWAKANEKEVCDEDDSQDHEGRDLKPHGNVQGCSAPFERVVDGPKVSPPHRVRRAPGAALMVLVMTMRAEWDTPSRGIDSSGG